MSTRGKYLGTDPVYIIYMNDLTSCIDFSEVIMYADDTVISFSSAQSIEVELKLNMEFTSLSEWLYDFWYTPKTMPSDHHQSNFDSDLSP